MNVLALDAVTKHYGMKTLLERISFGLEHDEKMGIIGANGSGKTTLLRIVAGIEPPDSGLITRAGAITLAYLPQNPVFDAEQTVLDAVFDQGSEKLRLLHDYEAAVHALERSGGSSERLVARVTELAHRLDVTGGWELEANAKAVLDRLGISDTDALVGTLSGGRRKRVALARALVLRPDLLILDEPTNHLDAETIGWLETYLARYSGALLLVTHDRYFLDRVTNRMLEIEKGSVRRFEGNYTYYLEKKAEQALQREAEADRRAGLVRRELAWLQRGARARATKQKAHVERARALIDGPEDRPERNIELTAAGTRLGKKVVDLEGVSKSYDGRTVLQPFTYRFGRAERVGIIGPNGAGKTTLLDLIAGRTEPDAGTVERGQTVVIGYYDQESRALEDEKRVIDYIRDVAEHIRTADGTLISAGQMLERFLFPAPLQYTPIGKLSGGERRRLYLLRVLMGAPNVLLLDEPTNDLDIPTLMALEDYLDSFDGCLVVVTHDRYFLDRTVEHLFHFEGEGRLREYPGSYTAFLEIREPAAEPIPRPAAAKSPAPDTPPAPRRLSSRERREMETLEARIAEAENRKAALEERLSTETSDYEAIQALLAELKTLGEEIDQDLGRWAELAEMA